MAPDRRRLQQVVRRPAITCTQEAPIRDALVVLRREGIGSMLVLAPSGVPVGIFTLRDLLAKVVLAGRSIADPISTVMTHDPITLPTNAFALDAALAMARHGVHHIVVADGASIAGVVSEKDLSTLQQLGLPEISDALREATGLPAIVDLSRVIRDLAGNLLKQGVSAKHLTQIVSTLNDVLSQRIIDVELAAAGLEAGSFCWISLGSEGRHEQTFATDQDNGIIFDPGERSPDNVREALLPLAKNVNASLAACGFPLCRGEIMAGNPRWCLSATEWRDAFGHWIFDGGPTAVLHSTIFFDFRPLHGQVRLAQELRGWLTGAAADNQRFLRQLAENALINRPPLGIVRDFSVSSDDAHPHTIDLKVNGATLFIDAARVFALATGVAATSSVERLAQWATKVGVPSAEADAWASAFHFLQSVRLRHQYAQICRNEAPDNHLNPDELNQLDRRILKETLRLAKGLQTRLALEYHL